MPEPLGEKRGRESSLEPTCDQREGTASVTTIAIAITTSRELSPNRSAMPVLMPAFYAAAGDLVSCREREDLTHSCSAWRQCSSA